MLIELGSDGAIEVVISTCYGGFGLSEKAILKMIEYGSDTAKTIYEKQKDFCKTYESFGTDELCRWDPILVKVVKELGEDANGRSAKLEIETVYLENLVDIQDYDGKERIGNW